MNKTAAIHELSWWNRRLLGRSVLVGSVFFLIFWMLAKRVQPVEGFVFERLPIISGKYKCCEAGGRFSQSWVGSVPVNCSPIGYYEFLGTGRNDCGRKAELNGRQVEVVRAIIPSFGTRSPLVVQISSDGKSFYELSDTRLRELWIRGALFDAVSLGLIFGVFFQTAQLIFVTRKSGNILNEGKSK